MPMKSRVPVAEQHLLCRGQVDEVIVVEAAGREKSKRYGQQA